MSRPQQRATTPSGATDSPGAADVTDADVTDAEQDEEEAPAAPWHFKLLLLGTAGYLVYRLIWFIFWLTGHGWHG